MLSENEVIRHCDLDKINCFLQSPNNGLMRKLENLVGKYGTPVEINARAAEAGKVENLVKRLRDMDSPYLPDLEWLIKIRDKGAFISLGDYRAQIAKACEKEGVPFHQEINESNAVTLEISAFQYFPWLIEEAKQAIDKKEIMPGRYIRVRKMKEQEHDNGDIMAVRAAMNIIGASGVETLDTKGTDGSNVHLGGPDTITGYFGGIGQPNEHPLLWVDEFLYYYTNYGVREVLNISPGTVLAAFMLYRLGVDIKFKISVFMGNDNAFSVLWTLMMARMLSRPDGSTPLIGFNISNSVNRATLLSMGEVRRQLGFENQVRIEHHVTETYRAIVRQPYNRRDDLVEAAALYPNISAKHEGGEPETEMTREHSSSILDYFRDKPEIESSGDMKHLLRNYLDKHASVNATAEALTKRGIGFIAATRLHNR
ncbi:MAG: hypothetical protein FWF87_08845 [Synergistaceae bacterium]|nr:hypothetical protein [Synergistaceae bacterium]